MLSVLFMMNMMIGSFMVAQYHVERETEREREREREKEGWGRRNFTEVV